MSLCDIGLRILRHTNWSPQKKTKTKKNRYGNFYSKEYYVWKQLNLQSSRPAIDINQHFTGRKREGQPPVTPKLPSNGVCVRTVSPTAFWDIFPLWAFLPPWWILENGSQRRKFVQVCLERRPDTKKSPKCFNTIFLVFVLKFSRTCTHCVVFQIFEFERRFGNSTTRQDE